MLWPAVTLPEGKKRGRTGKRGSGAEAEAQHGDRVSGSASAAGEEDDHMNDRVDGTLDGVPGRRGGG